jgi:hypothetical protein
MQSPLFDDREMPITRGNAHAEDSGRLMIGGDTDDYDDEFYLECGDCLFNISNLISEQSLKRSRSAQASVSPVSVRKYRERRIYPSRHQVESIRDIDIGREFAMARPVRSAESMVGYDGGQGPCAYQNRHTTSEYFANSGRNTYRSNNGIPSSRSVLLDNNDNNNNHNHNDTYSDYSDYSYHRRLQADDTTSSATHGSRDHYDQRYQNRAPSPRRNNNDNDRDHYDQRYQNRSPSPRRNDNDNDRYSDYGYHPRPQAEDNTTSSSTYGGSDHYHQRYQNRAPSPRRNPNPPASSGPVEVEISPGVFAPLRGSEETWRAIQTGNFETVVCVCCSNRIQCIADAEYVLCPECRVVSPMVDPYRITRASGQHIRGVGLGLLVGA